MPIQSVRAKLIDKCQLTRGNWEVSDREVWVDESRNLIYFTALKESPLERHLYVMSLEWPKHTPKRLTLSDFTHTTIAFNCSLTLFVDIESNITIPPFGYLRRIVHNNVLPDVDDVALILGTPPQASDDNDEIDLLPGMTAPTIFDYKLKSGDLIYGFMFKPECMETGVKYPVLLEIYGGPEVQLVSKSFKGFIVLYYMLHYLQSILK